MQAPTRYSISYFVRAGAVSFVAAALIPLTASGQHAQPLSPVQVEVRSSERSTLADQLDVQARTMYGTPKRFFEAGQLHRRAALLRGSDSAAVSSFRSAAWMFSAAGELSHARGMMEKAAERAVAIGDVEGAANCYIDAALLAIAGGRDEKVPALLGRMNAVLTSPLLPPERRSGILQRVGGSPTLAVLYTSSRAPE